MNTWTKIAFLSLFPLISSFAHDAHVHGEATLNIAIENPNKIEVEIDTPLINYISFEHKPTTKEEENELLNLLLLLSPSDVITFNNEATCEIKSFEHEFDYDHEHGNLELELEYNCQNLDQLKNITINLFEESHLQKINVQLVSEQIQKGYVITPDQKVISIK